MTDDTQIRYRPDGSIDIAYYMQRGRRLRSEQAHHMLGTDTSGKHQRLWIWRRIFGRPFPARA